MSISFRSSASATATTTVSTLTCNIPTGTQQYDVLIAATGFPNDWSSPGWTNYIDLSGNNFYYKIAGAAEPSNYTFTAGTSILGAAILIVAYAGYGVLDAYNGT